MRLLGLLLFLSVAGLLVVPGAPAFGQAPDVQATCVYGCGAPAGGGDDRPRGHAPTADEVRAQQLASAASRYQAVLVRINRLIAQTADLAPPVRSSVLSIFGNTRSLGAPPEQTDNYHHLEAAVRSLTQGFPGLASAPLYQSATNGILRNIADYQALRRTQQEARDDAQQWYDAHSHGEPDDVVVRQTAEQARLFERYRDDGGRLFGGARALLKRANASEALAFARLHLTLAPDLQSRSAGEVERHAIAYAHVADAGPSLLERAVEQNPAAPDWESANNDLTRVLPWYAGYRQATVLLATATLPDPPHAYYKILDALDDDPAAVRVLPEIDALGRNVDQLSDAVAACNREYKRDGALQKAAADDGASFTREIATPALHVVALETAKRLVTEYKNNYAKDVYEKSYAALAAGVWDYLAGVASIRSANPTATKSAVSLISEVHDLATNEFAEIMKGPAIIVHGDASEAAELQRRLDVTVCEFMSDRTPIIGNLPAFMRPYVEHRSCSPRG
jgi:hypothetical protein